MSALETLRLVITLLPVLIEAVTAIEAAMPQGGQGEAKLAAVRQILQGVYAATNELAVSFDRVWPALSATVSAVVALKNAAGQFKTAP